MQTIFPFVRGQNYLLGELRNFENDLLIRRQSDKTFSDELRSNKLSWAKLRNEELVPFRLLANLLGVPDSAEFKISPESHPGADIVLILTAANLSFQITVANPDWNGNGGRAQAFMNYILERDGVAWTGKGITGKKGSETSEPMAVERFEAQQACRNGLAKALERKLAKPVQGNCLLVYAREFWKELIDEGFVEFLEPVVSGVVKDHPVVAKSLPVFVVDAANGGPTGFSVNAQDVFSRIDTLKLP